MRYAADQGASAAEASQNGSPTDPLGGLGRERDQKIVSLFSKSVFLGRSSVFDPERHAVLHGQDYEALALRFLSQDAHGLAVRGRALRLMGRTISARRCLDSAVTQRIVPACALAWRWELDAGERESSCALLDRAISMEPKNGWWRLWRSVWLLSRKRPERALEEAEAAASILPECAWAQILTGLSMEGMHRVDRALARLDRALELEPAAWIYRLRARLWDRLGNEEACVADCDRALRLEEGTGTLFIPLGLWDTPRPLPPRAAADAAGKHLERRPRDYWAYVYRADLLRDPSINANSAALSDLRKAVELRPDCPWAWAYLGRAEAWAGQSSAARAALDRALELEPGCGWIWSWKGEFLRREGDLGLAQEALEEGLRLCPDYEMAYAWRGGLRRRVGRYREALDDLNTAIRLDGAYAWAYHERMRARRALGDFKGAFEDARQAAVRDPKFVWEDRAGDLPVAIEALGAVIASGDCLGEAYYHRGEMRLRLRDLGGALADLNRAVRAEPRSAPCRVLRGRVLGERGRWKAAFKDFDRAVRLTPESPLARAWRGRARQLTGDLPRALRDFAAALAKAKNTAWILGWQGEALAALRRWRDAEAAFSASLEIDGGHGECLLLRGACRLESGDRSGARADLDRALALIPSDPRLYFYRGLLFAAESRQADALKEFDRAAELPGCPRPLLRAMNERRRSWNIRRESDSTVERAERLLREGRHSDAAAVLSEALGAEPDRADYLALRSNAFRNQGRHDLALADLDAVVRLRPGDPAALVGRGEGKRHLCDPRGALADAEEALAVSRRDPGAWVLKAESLRNLGDMDAAVQAAGTAIEQSPRWPWTYVVRAKAKRQAGDLAGALDDLQRAQEAGPGDGYPEGWRGEVLRKSGRYAEAIAELDAAVSKQPQNAWFRALRGEARRGSGDLEKGLSDLMDAVRIDGNCSCAYDFLGAEPPLVRQDPANAWVYAWRAGINRKEGRLPQARRDLDHALGLDPACFWAFAWRGELRIQMHDLEGAHADLDAALRIHDGWSQAFVWKGQAYLSQARNTSALQCFDAALRREPTSVWALVGKATCMQLAGDRREAQAILRRIQSSAPGLIQRLQEASA